MTELTDAKTHDYTERRWGHNFEVMQVIDDAERLRLAGWGRGIKAGHFLVLPNGELGTTRYRVDSIEYCDNPRDMWFADTTFAPEGQPQ